MSSLHRIKNEEAWDKYNDYLNSEKWKLKRKKVFERDNYLCQACLTNEAQEVHHLTYNNIYDEPLYELISVCKRCHIKIEEQKQTQK
jgi:5-methylcytosine-specific restriction endonuclease McrA